MKCPEPSIKDPCYYCYNGECYATHWWECSKGFRKQHVGKKEQRFSLGHLYRCKKSDPLETVKVGRLYRLRKWNKKYIVCGEGFAISERVMPEYFERVMEKED